MTQHDSPAPPTRSPGHVRLNSAGRLAQSFVTSKLTPLFVVSVLLLALLSSLITPREENPQILVPGAQVTWRLPGATPSEIERLILAPMESNLREIEGVKHTFATAMQGMGQVQIEFHVGVDPDAAIDRVRHRVSANRSRLPAATLEPEVQQLSVDDVPILTLTFASHRYDDYALRRLAERVAERLNSLEQVSVTQVHGGSLRELRISLDPARLQAFGLTMNEGIAAITANNVQAVVGEVVEGNRQESVFLEGRLRSAAELRRLPLKAHDGQLIYLEDVADVHDGPPPEREQLTRFAFGPGDPRFSDRNTHGEMAAVTLSVAKKPNTNAVVVSRDVQAMVVRMKAEFVPADVTIVTTRDDGRNANRTVNNLLFDLTVAVCAVLVILVPTLGFRQAMIVALVVPLVLGLTLAVDLLADITINRMSMFGLILALGMLVDDAIVVMENIHRHYERGTEDRRWTAILATNEIGTPTTLATITIVLVFLSLQILTGMNGAFFYPVSFNVAVAIAVSLSVAYMVMPWACHRWLPTAHRSPRPGAMELDRPLYRRYRTVVTALVDHPGRANMLFAGTVVALLASMMMMAWQFIRPSGVEGPLPWGGVGLSIMPRENRNTFTLWLDLPEGTPIEDTDRVAREFGNLLAAEPLVENYQTYLGMPGVVDFAAQVSGSANRRGPNVAEIRVNLVDKANRQTQSGEIVDSLRKASASIRARHPQMDVRFVEAPSGPPPAAVILAYLHGKDPDVLRAMSATVKQRFMQTFGAIDVFDTEAVDREQVDIVVDKEKATLSGVTSSDIEQVSRALMDGLVVAETHLPGEKNPVPIRIRVPRERAIEPGVLDRIMVSNRDGVAIPLSELTRVERKPMERPILRRDNVLVSIVGGNVTSETGAAYAILAMDRALDGLHISGETLRTGNFSLKPMAPNASDGYRLLWDGEMRLTLDAFREMGVIFSVVLVTIYLLLVAAYRSFLLPLLGMIAIPLGLIGVFPGHWLTNANFSMGSLIGIVALAGLVIRNSLLIIDFIHDYQRQGHPLRDAVVMAGAVRLRPIFLTAGAVVLATLIMYRDPLFAGMATSLIFGTLVSTGLTLIALPPLYERVAKRFPEWVRGHEAR